MAIKTHKAELKWCGGLAVDASARGLTVRIDEPEAQGGTNSGMNPVEMMLCSLGGCEMLSFCVFAKFYGVKIDDISLEIEGDIDGDGFSGVNPAVRPGFQVIRFHYHIKSSAPEAQINQVMKMAQKRCMVGDSISAGVPLAPRTVTVEK